MIKTELANGMMTTDISCSDDDFPKLLEKAKTGDKNTQYELGVFYEEEHQYEKAIEWYRKSAEQGHIQAQLDLAFFHHIKITPPNYTEALKWYTKSAAQGNMQAQCNLGVMYENGEGVEINYEEAKKWYQKSAEQGLSEAKELLATLRHKTLTVIK